jgi:hypothetical protein
MGMPPGRGNDREDSSGRRRREAKTEVEEEKIYTENSEDTESTEETQRKKTEAPRTGASVGMTG